jgi:hypothetical protein
MLPMSAFAQAFTAMLERTRCPLLFVQLATSVLLRTRALMQLDWYDPAGSAPVP